MRLKTTCELILNDFERTRTHQLVYHSWRKGGVLRTCVQFFVALFIHDTFVVSFWFRVGSYLKAKKNTACSFLKPFYHVFFGGVKIIYKIVSHWTGNDIELGASIGGGLRMDHCNGIVIASSSSIGRNCTILNGVTLGRSFGNNGGCPIVGDYCVIYTGAKLIGNIRLGSHVIVGANSVVTKSFPDNCVIAGAPAKIISNDWKSAIDEKWWDFYALV